MNFSLFKLAKKYFLEHNKFRRWRRVIAGLAAVVVFVTTYMLILPAVTLENRDSGDGAKGAEAEHQELESVVTGSGAGGGEANAAKAGNEEAVMFSPLQSGEKPNWELSINADGEYTLTITGTGEIPASFISETAELAQYTGRISEVVISEGITAIGAEAFKDVTSLLSVKFAEGSALTTIGGAAFSGCTNLADINLEACTRLKTIDNAVEDSLNDVSLTKAGAFYNTALTSVKIPASLELLDSCTFYNCTQLKTVEIEAGSRISTLGFSVFGQCSALESINLEACQQDSISLLNGTLYWERGMFNGCSSLKTVTIPHGFGADAAHNNLRGFFRGCKSLESIVFEENHNITGVSGELEALIDSECINLKTLDLTPLKILTNISNWAFGGIKCSTVKFPASLKSLGYQCFQNSPNLTNIEFENPANLNWIEAAFLNCSALKEVDLSRMTGLETLGQSSFSGCTSLERVVLPSQLKYLGKLAFSGCTNLKEFVYNANNLKVTAGDNNKSCSDIFKDTDTNFTLNIGVANLSVLPAQILQSAAGHCGDVLFTPGEYKYFIINGADGGNGLPEPLGGLETAQYILDKNGVLYKLVQEEGYNKSPYTLHLVYCPPGVKELKVLSSINTTFSDGTKYDIFVQAVDPFSFCLARDLQSVTFPHYDKINSVGKYAFYGCESLTSVGGKTTVDDAAACFTAADVPANAFYNTGLTGAKDLNNPEGTKTTESIKVDDYLTVSVSGSEMYTGESATVSVAIGGQLQGSGTKYRLYCKCEDGFELPYSEYLDGNDFSLEGVTVRLRSTDVPNVYYYEFSAPSTEETVTFNLNYRYPNHTAGSKAQFWVIKAGNGDFGGENNVIPTTEGDRYFEAVWKTKENDFSINKSHNDNLTPKLVLIDDGGKIGLENLSYNINVTRKGGALEGKGNDFVRYFDFRDTLTLPSQVSYRDGVIDAIRAGHYGRRLISDKNIELYVTINGVEYTFCTLSNTNNRITIPRLELDNNDNPVLFWRENNTELNSSTKSEISNIYDTVTYGSDVLIVADSVQPDEKFEISNNVDADIQYSFAERQTVSASCGPTVVQTGTGDASLLKTLIKDSSYVYMGENVQYNVKLKNTSPFIYTVPNGESLNDWLSNSQYIKPEDIEKMFNDPGLDPDKLHICITGMNQSWDGATMLGTPVSGTVTTVDGEKTAGLSVQNIGTDIPYNGTETSDGSMQGDKYYIEISLDNRQLVAKCYKAPGGITKTIHIGDGGDEPDLKTALDKLGFIITPEVRYNIQWRIGGEKIGRGEEKSYTYTATVKDSFMLLAEDKYGESNGEVTLQNEVWLKNKTAKTEDHKVKKDFIVDKSAYINGNDISDGVKPVDGDIIDYRLKFVHYGSGSCELLPMVDKMSGMQVLLVPVESNKNQAWVNGETATYTTGGESYYILNKPGTYKGVWIGGRYADSVTVEALNGANGGSAGMDTLIKWYYTDIPSEEIITYKALLSAEHSGVNIESLADNKFDIINEVWLNDHQTHRLTDGINEPVPIIKLSKDIVEAKGAEPDDDKLNADGHSKINRGDRVVYRFTFENTQNALGTITGKDIYDALPVNLGKFNWSKDDIQIEYKEGVNSSYEHHGGDSWYIADSYPDIEYIAGQQYICWKDDFKITLGGYGKAYVYVTLDFPDNAEIWKAYCNANQGNVLSNVLHLYEFYDGVSHELVDKGRVLLQKGVYETGLWPYDYGSTGVTGRAVPGLDRFHYANQDVYKRSVSYYIIIRNSGNNRLYLNDIYDELPEGFEFYSLVIGTHKYGWHGDVRNDWIYGFNEPMFTIDGNAPHLATVDGIEAGANVTCEQLGIVNGHNMIKFSISQNTNDKRIHYDDNVGLCYLEPDEYITFGYTAFTGKTEQSKDEAVNTLAMEYYDYQNIGVELDTTTKINVSKDNGMSENNGSRELISNADAASHGFTAVNENSQWLASNVTVVRGGVVPGITKSVKNAVIQGPEVVDWEIKTNSNGEAPIIDYSITDTMQAPHIFTGEVDYSICYSYSDDSASNLVELAGAANDKLFTFGSRSEDGKQVNITTNLGKSRTLFVNSTPVQVEVAWKAGSTVNLKIRVLLKRDKETGNETLVIRFPDYRMAIPENGYGLLKLQTKSSSNHFTNTIYVNEAVFAPQQQEYDERRITQGNNITTAEGKNAGVRNSAFVTVATGYSTSSVKTITEKGNTDNYARSDSDKNYIMLNSRDKLFTYTLSVENNNNFPMDRLVIIDNLPEIGDNNTLVPTDARYSEFKVRLAENPDFKVSVGDTVLDPNQYTIEYSNKTKFTPDSEDWSPDYKSGWESNPSADTRSIRLVINDKHVSGNQTAYVSFDAVIDGAVPAKPGQTAWNSFAYSYTVNNSAPLFAAPLKVGLRIPGEPELSKSLVNTKGNAVKAQKNETFGFIIYTGDKADFADYQRDTIARELESLSRRWTYVDLTVNEGESVSEVKRLSGLKRYSFADNKFLPTTEDWSWDETENYNIVEVSSGGKYNYKSTNNINSRNYSFKYNASMNLNISYVNERPDWKIVLTKTDEEHNPLPGALFGAYSTDPSEAMSAEAAGEVKTLYGLGDDFKTVIEIGGVSYYLSDTAQSPEDGIISWTLGGDAYIVRELKAPDGYYFTGNDYNFAYDENEDTRYLTVENKAGTELPSTGGSGAGGRMSLTGGCAAAAAVILYLIFRRRRRTQ